jgi:hypothetical protein
VNLLHAFHEAGVIKKCCSETGAWKQEKKPLEMVISEFFYLQIRKCVISLKNSNQSLLIKLTTIISFFFSHRSWWKCKVVMLSGSCSRCCYVVSAEVFEVADVNIILQLFSSAILVVY